MYNTVSLEVAKKLKEAGWKKETIFHWAKDGEQDEDIAEWIIQYSEDDSLTCWESWNAPQIHEILEELPDQIEDEKWGWYGLNLYQYGGEYTAYYQSHEDPLKGTTHCGENPHDACALLWIWCKENKYI